MVGLAVPPEHKPHLQEGECPVDESATNATADVFGDAPAPLMNNNNNATVDNHDDLKDDNENA